MDKLSEKLTHDDTFSVRTISDISSNEINALLICGLGTIFEGCTGIAGFCTIHGTTETANADDEQYK